MKRSYVFICLLCSGWLPVGNLDSPGMKCVSETENQHINQTKIKVKSRSKRFLSFNQDESSIKVELNFAVPFLEIPVGGKSLEKHKESKNSIIDINTKSLITTSALIIMFVFIAPRVIRLILPHTRSSFYRGTTDKNEVGSLIHDFEAIMDAMKIDTDACWQKTVCLSVQTSARRVDGKQGSSWNKIIDGLARNDLFRHLVQGTSTYQAIKSGLMEDQCNLLYKSCNFDARDIIIFFKKLRLL